MEKITREGVEELLAATEIKHVSKRHELEWLCSKQPRLLGEILEKDVETLRSGRTPMDIAQRAKMNYVEGYNKTNALTPNKGENVKRRLDSDLVDKYKKEKHSKSLVEKHREESSSSSSRLLLKKKLSSSNEKIEKEEWVRKHLWKPWDRGNDLAVGRQKVKLDAEGIAEGLASK